MNFDIQDFLFRQLLRMRSPEYGPNAGKRQSIVAALPLHTHPLN